MPINEEDIKKIIQEVVKNLESEPNEKSSDEGPIFDTFDSAIKKSAEAQQYFQSLGLEKREKKITAIREVSKINA
ncbi:MAG: hypothetical protein N2Z60_05640, partial [Elusimicrobiales bacterium]|nr:hypothetical protein [Elusimicrobiales bacterium]